ncbi:50S ribosomal protein L1 [Arsenophonus symbiont of Ornithomya chloropus]|uniref:50S ribosomal protein L1 n=1 Tax=Arsenophonus symbiont of Ornithomya chloropus TaxID=634121 RepID=UPI0032B1B254
MGRLSKRMHNIYKKVAFNKVYDLMEGIIFLKELSCVKFIESVDIAINLGIDSRKSEQNIRSAIMLPHGTGRKVCVAVFAQGINAEKAKSAGAELVGMEELSDKIKAGYKKFDIVIASPDTMPMIGPLAHILGPRGLMPNPKMGTVTTNITEAVKNAKSGQIYCRNDKNGIIHTTIGKINFDNTDLKENIEALLLSLQKLKPSSSKGIYIKKISLSTTMGPSLILNQKCFSI